jgi:hypothetical protein
MTGRSMVAGIGLIIAFCFGSVFAQSNRNTEVSKTVLKERLSHKKVEFIEKSDNRTMLNPLMLEIKIIKDENLVKFTLNGEKHKLDELTAKLKEISQDRQKNGIFLVGTNAVDMRITLAAKAEDIINYTLERIFVEDFENLIGVLQKEGFKQISVDLRRVI